MRVYENLRYKQTGYSYHLLDLYLPDGECKALLLYLHGGGLIEGGRKDVHAEHPFVRDMVAAGFGVASADYILYPDARFPDYIEDAAAAVKFAKESLKEYGDYGKLVVGGTSAGGYISQMLCFDRSYLETVGVSPDDISAYVHDAGQPTVHFNVLRERGFDHRRIIIDEAAPLYHVGLEKSYPPMQFIVSDNDIPGRLEQTDLIVSTLYHFGIDTSLVRLVKTSGKHIWYVNAVDGDGKSEFGKIVIPFLKSIV